MIRPMQDSSWEQYGAEDPYYGVLTDPRFKSKNLDDAALKDFFQSGEAHVTEVLNNINKFFPHSDSANFKEVLDFGCGTGRLLIPFAQRFEQVTGVDIAPGMLEEAVKNLSERQLNNVTCIQSADITSINFKQLFDFVHTYIVLQHVPLEPGYGIVDKLLSLIKEGGYGMIHFTYSNNQSAWKNTKLRLMTRYGWLKQFANILKGKKPGSPVMQMNSYDLPRVFSIVRKYKPKQICLDFTDHGGHFGVCLYLQR